VIKVSAVQDGGIALDNPCAASSLLPHELVLPLELISVAILTTSIS